MPNTVAQHALVAFSSPTNGSTPIDANTVRGNDNTIRTSYNNHDADPGIHVQSSTLAARPAAGTAGRKWITADAGSYKLWYDDGSSWNEIANAGLNVFVVAGENLVKGDIIKVTGYNTVIGAPTVAKITAASDVAFGLVTGTIASGSTGYVANMGLVTDVATNAFSIGNTLYPNTSGGLTSTKPTSGTYQPVAYVLRSDLTNGVLYVEFSSPRIVERSDNTVSTLVLRDASGNFAAGTITANLTGNISGTAPAGTLTGTTLASNVVNSSLTSVGTLGSLTVTNPITGSVTGSSGSTTGNAATATTLQTARNINGVSFNGSADITVTADAGTLSGSTLASGVTASSLTSVGTLTSLGVSGNLTVDTNTLFVDAANNRVGIGTASPSHPFQISTSTLIVDTSGNLGIGVTPSAWEASAKAIQTPGGSIYSYGDATLGAAQNGYFDGAWKYKSTAAASSYYQNAGAHVWSTAASGTADGAISFVQAMTLDASGRLGIGTASPATTLHVDASGGGVIRVTRLSAGAGVAQIESDGTDATFSATNVLKLSTASAERARIDASGNLMVGATSSTWRLNATVASGADRDVFSAQIAGASNGLTVKWDHATLKTRINIADIPTASAGLPAGTLWSDSGTIKIA
jgi:hypothetical protein